MVLPFYNVWIIKKPAGMCLLDMKLQDLPTEFQITIDGNLLSGLLTSFSQFTEEILQEPIRIFETKSFKVMFYVEPQFYFAVLCSSKLPIAPIEALAHRLAQILPTKFPEILADDFDGNVSRFDDLKKELETLKDMPRIKQIRTLLKKGIEIRTAKKLAEIQKSIEDLKNKESEDSEE
jgi:hypothetical protein